MNDNNERMDTAVSLLRELRDKTSAIIENHSKQLANDLQLIAGLSALLENHTAALKSHQTLLESIAAKVGIKVTVADQDVPPAASGPIN
jgi:hypothetical protein